MSNYRAYNVYDSSSLPDSIAFAKTLKEARKMAREIYERDVYLFWINPNNWEYNPFKDSNLTDNHKMLIKNDKSFLFFNPSGEEGK